MLSAPSHSGASRSSLGPSVNPTLNRIDMDRISSHGMPACNQFYDAADIAANISDVGDGKTVLHVSPDQLLITHIDNLEKLPIVAFEVTFSSGSRAVQLILQGVEILIPTNNRFPVSAIIASPLGTIHNLARLSGL